MILDASCFAMLYTYALSFIKFYKKLSKLHSHFIIKIIKTILEEKAYSSSVTWFS